MMLPTLNEVKDYQKGMSPSKNISGKNSSIPTPHGEYSNSRSKSKSPKKGQTVTGDSDN